MKKSSVYLVFALMMVLLMAVTLISSRIRDANKPFDIGDLSGIDRVEAEKTFQESGSDGSLIAFLKVLCYDYKIEGDETVIPQIREYGQMLLDRAKAGSIDLEKMDKDGDILQILDVIRSTGAK